MWIVFGLSLWLGCPTPDPPPGTSATDAAPTGDTGSTTDLTTPKTTPKPKPLPDLHLVPTCEEAAAQDPLPTGTYAAEPRLMGHETGPSDRCTSYQWVDNAPEALARVEAAPGEVIELRAHGLYSILYLLDDCTQPQTCGATGRGSFEPLVMVNESANPRTWFVGVESSTRWPWPVQLDVSHRTGELTPMPSTCKAAEGAPGWSPGTWYDRVSDTDPGVPTCGSDRRTHPGRIVPVDVPAGQQLSVTSNTSVSIFRDCEQPETACLGRTHWMNTSASPQRVYISAVQAGDERRSDVKLEWTVSDPGPTLALTTQCAAAAGGPAVAPGTYLVTFDGDLAPVSGVCTIGTRSEEGEVYVPIDVPPHSVATIATDLSSVSGYWAGSCTDPVGTCRAGASINRRLVWHNDRDTTVRQIAVLSPSMHTSGVGTLDYSLVSRTADPLPDTCGEAAAMDPIDTAGTYTINLSGAQSTFDFHGTCLRDVYNGSDRVLPIDVPARTRLVVERPPRLPGWGSNAIVFALTTRCGDPDTCVDKAETGSLELVDWVNATQTPEVVFLVVDQFRNSSEGVVDVEIRYETPDTWLDADTCDDAPAEGVAGHHFGTLEGATDAIDPRSVECALGSGEDVWVPVTLSAGEQIEVRAHGIERVYWLEGCDEDRCLVGRPTDDGPLTYVNTSPDEAAFTLVLDGPAEGTTGFPTADGDLDFDVQMSFAPSTALPAGETCADAGASTPIGAGTYHVDFGAFAGDDIAPTCGYLPPGLVDVAVPIELPAHTEVVVRANGSADVVPYLLGTCDDGASCPLPGPYPSPEGWMQARMVNPGDVSETWTLVLESAATDVVSVEVTHQPRDPASHWSTCAEAQAASSLGTGRHLLVGDLGTFPDVRAPGGGACHSGWVGEPRGGDALVPILLLPGERVDASLSQFYSDATVYLLRDCADLSTCEAGRQGGWIAELDYTNQSGAAETWYVGIDSVAVGGPFALDLTIQ